MGDRATHRFIFSLVLLGVSSLGTSCVSKAKYDEALAEIKFYQRSYQDLEAALGPIEAENERLKGELQIYEGQPAEAGLTQEIDERLEELRAMMGRLGTTPGDVEIIPIEGGYGVRMSEAILFDSGSATIKPDGRALLLEMAKQINTKPYARLWVRGHTDSDPVVKPETKQRFPHGNLELSAERALQVAVLLTQEAGVPQKKLVIAGFGQNAPIVPNDSATHKRLNRRVEIFVLDEEE